MSTPTIEPGPSVQLEGQSAVKVSPDFHESALTRFNLFLAEVPGQKCNFWLGLAKQGVSTPQQIMSAGDVATMLDAAAEKGICDEAPLMMSDTSLNPSQFMYLMPVPDNEFRDRSLWIHRVLETVKSWHPQSIGIYLHPTIMLESDARDLLTATLTALIETTGIHNYYLLVGSHGVNDLINIALKVKTELESAEREVVVFH